MNKLNPYFFLSIVFISEYFLGTILVVVISILFEKFNYFNFISHDLIVFFVKILLSFVLFKVLIRENFKKYFFIYLPKINIVIYTILLSFCYYVLYKLIFDGNFSLMFKFNKFGSSNVYFFSAIIFGPIYEELLYRGYGIEYLKQNKQNNLKIILFTSLIFSTWSKRPTNKSAFSTGSLEMQLSITSFTLS